MVSEGGIWEAGHVNDIVELEAEGSLVIAAQTGGVWHVTPTGASQNFSHEWDNPDGMCLARGPNSPHHIYAGCGMAFTVRGNLYETEYAAAEPFQAPWVDITPVPFSSSGTGWTQIIFRILIVLGTPNRIVLGTNSGMYWADIPTSGHSYSWNSVQQFSNQIITGLALGPNSTFVAAVKSDTLYYGGWVGNQLVMTPATCSGLDITNLQFTTMASCEQSLNQMYAVISAVSERPLGVVRSNDGGHTWVPTPTTLLNAPSTTPPFTILTAEGVQGNGWDNCIAVSPTNPKLVAFGFEHPCLSTDGGTTWNLLGGNWANYGGVYVYDPSPPTHADQHGILFSRYNPQGMYFASDGGICSSPDLGKTFIGTYNKGLTNLQFLAPYGLREWYGESSASSTIQGLVGGGLMDQGNIYCVHTSNAAPWFQLEGGDGGVMLFWGDGNLLRWGQGQDVSFSRWTGTHFGPATAIPVTGNSAGLGQTPHIEAVTKPDYQNSSGELMYVVAAARNAGTGNIDIYGLFATDVHGGNIHWEVLGSVQPPDASGFATALAAFTGKYVYVGMTSGQVTVLDSMNGTAKPATGFPPVPVGQNPNVYSIGRIVLISETEGFASNNVYPSGGSLYYTADGKTWQEIKGLPYEVLFSMALNPTTNPPGLYVVTDNEVWYTPNKGQTWLAESQQLPKRSHGADIRFVAEPGGAHSLYLGTYGWSMYVTQLT